MKIVMKEFKISELQRKKLEKKENREKMRDFRFLVEGIRSAEFLINLYDHYILHGPFFGFGQPFCFIAHFFML